MKKKIQSVTFNKGMIENIKQDLPNEVNPVFDSALWIQNYNPNLQRESLILRGEMIEASADGDTLPFLDIGLFSSFSTLVGQYGDNNANVALKESVVIHNEYMQCILPVYGEVFIRFIRRFPLAVVNMATNGDDYIPSDMGITTPVEATAVVAYVPYYNNSGLQHGWFEAHTELSLSGTWVEFPGWYALGMVSDVARYGESIMFCNVFNEYEPTTELTTDVKNKCYPVYVWNWWDLSKKRAGINGDKKFWNGLDVGDLSDPKYRLWRIRKPSMQIVKDNIVEAVALYDFSPMTWCKFDGTACDGTNESPVQLLIWESPIQVYDFNSFRKDTVAHLLSDIKDIAERDYHVNSIYATYRNPNLNLDNISYIDSIETLDIPGLYAYDNMPDVPLGINRRNKQTESANGVYVDGAIVEFPISDPSADGDAAWSVTGGFAYYEHPVECNVDGVVKSLNLLICYTEDRGSEWRTQADNEYLEQRCTYRDPYSSSGGTNGDAAGITTLSNAHAVFGTKLPNYLEANIPRQWICGEEIPFLLTATINGVEVQILKDTYRVSTKNYALLPQLCSPFWWSNENGLGIGPVPYMRTTYIADSSVVPVASDYIHPMLAHDEFARILAARINTGGHEIALSYYHGVLFTGSRDKFTVKRRITMGYEPFNPSSEILTFNVDHKPYQRFVNPKNIISRFQFEDYNTRGINLTPYTTLNSGFFPESFDEFRMVPYFPELCEGNTVHFGLRIKNDMWQDLSSQNVTAFNLYVSKPDFNDSILRSVGTIDIQEPPSTLYAKPIVKKHNIKTSQDFALVKTWLIEGEGQTVGDWDNYKGSPLATNAWYEDTDWTYAVPQDNDGTARTSLPTFVDFSCKTAVSESASWTPDFMLWDYPTRGKTLSLNSNGEYYDGIGARLIEVIKGRVFIGGCLDADGKEDPALVRYSDVQSGVIAQDIFSEANKIRIGHNYHTAYMQYREQLWLFSRYDHYRIQFPNVYDESTWEFLDATDQGTLSPKLLCSTPYGIVFGNETGVWLTDGRIPSNIGLDVLPTWNKLLNDDPVRPAFLGDISAFDVIPITAKGWNEYLEVTYDQVNDELICSTPIYRTDREQYISQYELWLIYNFPNQNWRVEKYDIPRPDAELIA